MSYPRVNRINEEYKKEISHMIRSELKDPRISKMTSVVSVEVTRDLSYATVYVSILGTETETEETLEALTKSAGYIRREIGKRIKLHHTPAISFKKDSSIEYGVSMSQKINALKTAEKEAHKDGPEGNGNNEPSE